MQETFSLCRERGLGFQCPYCTFLKLVSSQSTGKPWIQVCTQEVTCQVLTSQVQDGMGESIALIDGYSVGDPAPRGHSNAAGTTRDIQGQHSLDGYVRDWGVEGLMHELSHLLQSALEFRGASASNVGCFSEGHT